MKKGSLIALVVIAILAIWAYTGYNKVVTLNIQADTQWAQVENAYQRRFDLIPNLVSATKGALTQEQKVFGDIAEARTRYSGATSPDSRAAAASQVEGALGRLLVITENYPVLQSNQTIRDLMTSLEGTENRVNVERNRYNDLIGFYNTAVSRFPANILAGIFGFHSRSFFQATGGAEVAPTVNLQ